MRRRRRALSTLQQKTASVQVSQLLLRNLSWKLSRRWALYLSNDGEIDLRELQRKLVGMKREMFLPVLHPVYHNRLWFVYFDENTHLIKNKYGIREPCMRRARRVPTWTLDLVCLPLVAFDCLGNRLGMGGGYYDRSFSKLRVAIRRPLLIGTAHEFQKVDQLPSEPWDVKLDAVVTERRAWLFAPTGANCA